jgi:hypothetical protein
LWTTGDPTILSITRCFLFLRRDGETVSNLVTSRLDENLPHLIVSGGLPYRARRLLLLLLATIIS